MWVKQFLATSTTTRCLYGIEAVKASHTHTHTHPKSCHPCLSLFSRLDCLTIEKAPTSLVNFWSTIFFFVSFSLSSTREIENRREKKRIISLTDTSYIGIWIMDDLELSLVFFQYCCTHSLVCCALCSSSNRTLWPYLLNLSERERDILSAIID